MPIIVRPIDGFISRLLQQHHRSAGGGRSSSRPAPYSNEDQVSMSDYEQKKGAGVNQNSGKLESSLLGLYNNRGDM